MDPTRPVRFADWLLLRRLRPSASPGSVALKQLGTAANDSKLWVATAALLAATGPRGRRSAAEGLVAIGASSLVVNGPLKQLARRRRPAGPMALGLSPSGRAPKTSSFPSGHAATAAAFTTAAALASPRLAAPLGAAALAVGWSRIVSVRHFPSDVAAGLAVGAVCGVATHLLARRSYPAVVPQPSTVPSNWSAVAGFMTGPWGPEVARRKGRSRCRGRPRRRCSRTKAVR
jgi:undecaprenyl-diphosphatase